MKDFEIRAQVQVYEPSELPADLQHLVALAKQECKDSYAPYSHFHVGAAVRMSSGSYYTGANQENAAYPSGLCAERTTLFYAHAQEPNSAVEALAIAAESDGRFTDRPCPPCGACRQVMIESERRGGRDMKVVLYGEKEVYVLDSARHLLPLVFSELY